MSDNVLIWKDASIRKESLEAARRADEILRELIAIGLRLMTERGVGSVSAATTLASEPATAAMLREWTQVTDGVPFSVGSLADVLAGAFLKKSTATTEADRKVSEKFADEIMSQLVHDGRLWAESKQVTTLEAATHILNSPGGSTLADRWAGLTGQRLTAGELSILVAEAILATQKSAKPLDIDAMTKDAEALTTVYELARDRVLALGRDARPVFDAYQKSLSALRDGRTQGTTEGEIAIHAAYLAA